MAAEAPAAIPPYTTGAFYPNLSLCPSGPSFTGEAFPRSTPQGKSPNDDATSGRSHHLFKVPRATITISPLADVIPNTSDKEEHFLVSGADNEVSMSGKASIRAVTKKWFGLNRWHYPGMGIAWSAQDLLGGLPGA